MTGDGHPKEGYNREKEARKGEGAGPQEVWTGYSLEVKLGRTSAVRRSDIKDRFLPCITEGMGRRIGAPLSSPPLRGIRNMVVNLEVMNLS